MQEKRHIVLYASKYKDKESNHLLRMFDVLCKAKEMDETAIKKKYAHEAFVKNFAASKYKLQMLIMKSLDNYHSGHTITFEIQEMLRYFDILFGKGLFTHCRSVINKAQKLAEQYEKFPLLIEILQRQRSLFGRVPKSNEMGKNFALFFNLYEQTLQKIKNEKDYLHILVQVELRMHQKGVARSEKESQLFKQVMANPILQNEGEALSTKAKLLFNAIHMDYWESQNNEEQALKYAMARLRIFETSEELIKENISQYITAYFNILNYFFRLNRPDELNDHLKIFHTIPIRFKTDPRDQIRIFAFSNILEMDLCKLTGRFEEAVSLEATIKEGLEKYGNKLPYHLQFDLYFNLAYANFGAGKYKAASLWLRKIITEGTMPTRTYNYSYALLFNLVVHNELQEESLLESLTRSAYRHLLKMEHLHGFERAVINFIRKALPGIHSGEELITAFITLKKELEKLAQDPYEKEGLVYFDFVSWLESKIEKRPFAEILREKASRKIINS